MRDTARPTSAVRPAAAAGAFYPRRPERLEQEVRDLLAAAVRSSAEESVTSARALAGLIVPHAGYRYSGPVAAVAYARLADERPRPEHLVVLGPAHFVPLRGTAVPRVDAWELPGGLVAIDPLLRDAAEAVGARVDDRPHAPEHAVEVQLPFLALVCPGVPVLPVAVGDAGPDEVAELVAHMAAVPGTLVIVSSDLSHYLDQAHARGADERTARAIESCDVEAIGPSDACGASALCGVLHWAARVGSTVHRLRLATSADTAGMPDRVVGYGAFALERVTTHALFARR